jgi:hypothetical protein
MFSVRSIAHAQVSGILVKCNCNVNVVDFWALNTNTLQTWQANRS